MRTEEEIREELNKIESEFGQPKYDEKCQLGMITALKWVLNEETP